MADTQAGFAASAAALDSITNAAENHPDLPQSHLHRPANHESAHAWLAKIIPEKHLDNMENRFHMGNYVIDRQTGEKSFEAMSIYVRLGMHLYALEIDLLERKVLWADDIIDCTTVMNRRKLCIGKKPSNSSRTRVRRWVVSMILQKARATSNLLSKASTCKTR